jgi:hypothetical protein
MPVAVIEPVVYAGDPVRFRTSHTLYPRTGRVCASELVCGITYAEIVPDDTPKQHVFLFPGAVWGFQLLREGQ